MLNKYHSWFASLRVLLLAMMLCLLGCSISEKPKVDKLSSLWNGKQY